MSSVADAARSGDHRALLVAIRDTLAQEIDAAIPAQYLGPITGRLVEVSRELHAQVTPENETEAERIAREARGKGLDE